MRSRYAKVFQFIIIVGDLFLLNACFVLAAAVRFDEIKLAETEYYDDYLNLLVFFNISWLLLTFIFKTHETKRALEPRKATSKVLNAYSVHIFLLLLLLVSLKKDEYSRLFLIYFYSSFLVTVLPWRFLFLRLLKNYRKKGLNYRSAVLLGDTPGIKKFCETVENHPEYGLRISAYFSNNPVAGIPVTGKEEDLETWVNENKVDEVYAAFLNGEEKMVHWFKWTDENLIRFRIIPNLGITYSEGVEMDFYHDIPILIHRLEPLEYIHNRILKRALDIIVSLIIVVTIFPWLMPLLAIGVKLSGRGPILFKQKRSGIQDDEFTIYKFRSMSLNKNADKDQAIENDARLTVFGAFIRKFSLDELPQFFNVLKGDMSISGPRPHMLTHTEEYRKLIDQYMVRHFAKPGITGLAQINGYRGEVKNITDIEERIKYDVYYIENWSVLLDVKIIIVTIFRMAFLGK